MGKRASIKPSEAEQGGDFGFPAGAIVTITEAKWGTWEEAGEKAITKNRRAEDPALILSGEIEGDESDKERKPVFLGAGKYERLVPSDDGEFLEIAEGSSAKANSAQSNSNVFIDSLCDKKTHGKSAADEDYVNDNPISEVLVGLKFVAGGKIVKRDFSNDNEGREQKGGQRPTLVVDEILEASWLKGKTAKKSGGTVAPKKAAKPAPVEEEEGEEEETPAPKKGKVGKGAPDSGAEKAAMAAVITAFENPKYRNGIPSNRLYAATYAIVKNEDNADAIMKFVSDEAWAQDEARPWVYDGEEEKYTAVE
jgi:hypothetical protein